MLSDDGLEMYFSSKRELPGTTHLYVARRASRKDPFTVAEKIVQLATPDGEDDPYVEPDGLGLWFNSAGEIFRSTRASRAAPWDPPILRTDLSSPFVDDAPGFTSDGLTVYFDSTRGPNLGQVDIWSATRARTSDPFGNLRHEAVASSASFDCCPHVLPGESQVAFTTQRTGTAKIFVADRMPDGSLAAANPLPLVNSTATDFDVFSTPDGTTFGVASDRATTGDVDLWLYERSCP